MLPETKSPEQSPPGYLAVAAADGQVQLRFHTRMLGRLEWELNDGLQLHRRESGGVLLGRRERIENRTIVTIDDYRPIESTYPGGTAFYRFSDAKPDELERCWTKWHAEPDPEARMYAVGFYRTESREIPDPELQDSNFILGFLPQPSLLVLLHKPEDGPRTASVYVGTPSGFPDKPDGVLPLPGAAKAPDTPVLFREPLPPAPLPPPPQWRPRGANLRTIALAACALVLIAGLVIIALLQYRALQAIKGQQAGATKVLQAGSELGLRAERRGKTWELSWNAAAAPIMAARRGRLSILDGFIRKDIDLTEEELRRGKVLYEVLTEDLALRLEVYQPEQGKSVSESVRVLTRPWGAPEDSMLAGQDLLKSREAELQRILAAGSPRKSTAPVTGNAAAAANTDQPPQSLARFVPPTAQRSETQPQPLPSPPAVSAAAEAPPRTLPTPTALAPAPPAANAPEPPKSAATPATASSAADGAGQAARARSVGGRFVPAVLLRRTEPVYPPIAKQARVAGTVRLRARIGADGRITRIEPTSGPRLLVKAAEDAVRQWRYKPALLNEGPIESTMDIDVVFSLNR